MIDSFYSVASHSSVYPQPFLILYPVYSPVLSRVQFKLPFTVSGSPKMAVTTPVAMVRPRGEH